MRFRIKQNKVYDEYGVINEKYYMIEELSTGIFGGPKWKALKHVVCYGADVHSRITEFKTQESASEMIDKLLQGIPRNTQTSEIVG